MPLPAWVTDKSKTKTEDSPAERIREEQINKTKAREAADPELSVPLVRVPTTGLSGQQEIVEIQYEGSSLEYHGYTSSD